MIKGSVVKSNIDIADVVFDASADPNTTDMLSLSRLCPLEKRVSATVLYSPIEVGRTLTQAIQQCSGKVVYITGNGMKALADFDITEDEIVEWLAAVLKVASSKGVKIDRILVDGGDGVGAAAVKAATQLGIEVGNEELASV